MFVIAGSFSRKREAKVASVGPSHAFSRTVCMGNSSVVWCQHNRRSGRLLIISKQPTSSRTVRFSIDGSISWFRWKADRWFKGRVCKCAGFGRCPEPEPRQGKLHGGNASGQYQCPVIWYWNSQVFGLYSSRPFLCLCRICLDKLLWGQLSSVLGF